MPTLQNAIPKISLSALRPIPSHLVGALPDHGERPNDELARYAASPNATSHSTIVLIPETYSKNLPAQLRRSAVESLHKHLLRATLSSHGRRSGSEEAAIWSAVHLTATDAVVRKEVVLRAVIDMEVRRCRQLSLCGPHSSEVTWRIQTDVFFLAATPQGYRDRFEVRKDAIKSLADRTDWVATLTDPATRTDLLTTFVQAARLYKAGCYTVKARHEYDDMDEE